MSFWKPGNAAPSRTAHHAATEKAADGQRGMLPIAHSRLQLLFLVETTQVVVVVGQTGSGKTTQIPQFLAEAGYGAVACTQPATVAVASVAARVAAETGDPRSVVYRASFTDPHRTAKIAYLTDEALFMEAMLDPMLARYSVIMVDEAHERSLYSDLLLAIIKKIIRKRPELRVIVSSATIDAEMFRNFFHPSTAILSIPGKQYNVDIYHSIEPVSNYILEAVENVFRINAEKPGDILVFLTGREQVDQAVQLINDRASVDRQNPMYAVPLYAGLDEDDHKKVFDMPIPGTRKVVVATNVAEASITIDGIVYVIDCGFLQTKMYDPSACIERLIVAPISQASAIQRAGRAGRTRPGKVYRLYTEDAFSKLDQYSTPEIQRTNLAGPILQLKAIGIENILKFDFLSKPSVPLMTRSLELLFSLNAIDENSKLTRPFGNIISQFPLKPMLATLLINSFRYKCTQEALIIAAMLSVQSVFVTPRKQSAEAKISHAKFAVVEGDFITFINIFTSFLRSHKSSRWCATNFLDYKTLTRAELIHAHLTQLLQRITPGVFGTCGNDLESLRKCIVTGFFSNAAKLQPNGTSYLTVRFSQKLIIHPSSVLARAPPPWLLFAEVLETNQPYMRNVVTVEPEWLTEIAPQYYCMG